MPEVEPRTPGGSDDATLVAAVRSGDVAAFGELYVRHLPAARRAAMSLGAKAAEHDDLIAEGFARVLRALRTGHGPHGDFRPYLLRTIRTTVISRRRRDASVSPVAEMPDIPSRAGEVHPMTARIRDNMAAAAFAELPERWRTVLWRTEIEGEQPRLVAEQLGMTSNGVAALTYRARRGLRQAYLNQYVPASLEHGYGAIAD